jgi:SAM-dependent methyltransferase
MPEMTNGEARAFYEFERTGWERVADDYHRYFADLTTGFIEPLLSAGGVARGCRVLDVATGPGYVAGAAARRGADVVGVDFAEAAVAVARQQFPALEFEVGSAEELPFPDAAFDVVVMNFGLLHVSQPEQALAEAHRVLRSGGRVAYSVWGDPQVCAGFKLILGAIAEHGNMDIPLPDGPPFFRFSDPAESRNALTDAGFLAPKIEEVHIEWELPSADTLYDTFLHGAVRTGALLKAQTPKAQADIRLAVRQGVYDYLRNERILLPMAAVISSGNKS